MNTKGFTDQLNKRINALSDGTPFVASDFSDITDAQTIRRLLKKQVDNRELERIIPGVFFRPKISKLLNEKIPVDPHQVAEAIARSKGWKITASGETALNRLGLSTQIPVIWTYMSDGPYKKYEIDGAKLKFKHTTNKNLDGLSPLSRLVIQALSTLGKDRITPDIVLFLSDRFTMEEKMNLTRETKRVTEWIREIIMQICK
ncbi:MAG: DUF6088 family protein [Anaerolineaceae bacterium]|jgi:hypothetical protein|nr:DUF6088 family protein [Anaerolineaceae bacterium]